MEITFKIEVPDALVEFLKGAEPAQPDRRGPHAGRRYGPERRQEPWTYAASLNYGHRRLGIRRKRTTARRSVRPN